MVYAYVLTPFPGSTHAGLFVLPESPEGIAGFIAASKPERPHHEISR
jgi:hypothetical protein